MDIQISNFLKILKKVFDEKKDISLEEPVDWERMSRIAREQNLLPLFFEAACTNEQYAKTSVFVKDQMDTFSMVAEQIQRSNALLEVYEKISAQGIYPIVMKGLVCRQLYGELGEHRPSGDEDLLVEEKDFYTVKEILEQEGYICGRPDITPKELAQVKDVSFRNPMRKLLLEVHIEAIGRANEERAQMNDLFPKAHEHGQIIQIYGIDVKSFEPTELLLFLILHAYKHFQYRGVGIRQALDILLCYKEYKDKISMERLHKALKICKAETFWLDILFIGNKYLGIIEEIPEITCCPEVLLQDMIEVGVFGKSDMNDCIAASVQFSMRDQKRKHSKLHILFSAAFPSKKVLQGGYPFLVEQPWRLPMVWVKRWFKFIQYAKKDVWKISNDILQKSSARMEITKKYKK